jgi:two-component system NtrC family sensor kinase
LNLHKVNKYFIAQTPQHTLFYDTDFNLIAKSNASIYPKRFIWSDALNTLIYYRTNNSRALRFTKQSLYARINDDTKRIITWVSVLSVLIVLFFWVITMIISRRKIAERNKELSVKQNELEMATAQLIHSEKLAALGTVAASFAHQLNSPIGAILNSGQRLTENINNENLDLIIKSAEHCKSVIGRFLIASRTQRDDESSCCEFNDIWDNWRELFYNEFMNYKINIITEFSHSENSIAIGAGEFQEILSNIMFNARDSIIEADNDEKYIKITTSDNDSFLNIVIEDSGKGFDEKIMDNLFDAFITTKKEGVGTGLGLWITRKLLNKVNGNISISNTANGAMIILNIPIC